MIYINYDQIAAIMITQITSNICLSVDLSREWELISPRYYGFKNVFVEQKIFIINYINHNIHTSHWYRYFCLCKCHVLYKQQKMIDPVFGIYIICKNIYFTSKCKIQYGG